MQPINFELLTVAEAAQLMGEVADGNDYLAMDHGGVTVIVARGRARSVALRALRAADTQPSKKFRRKG